MEAEESQIVRRCKEGQSEEFGKLYDAYFGKIYRFIYYRVGQKETAEDLTSRTFMKALEKLMSFDESRGSFSSWIYRIARNTVIDYYRTKKDDVEIYDFWDLASGEDMNRDLDVRMKLDEVKKYLKELNEEQKEIIILRIWDGLLYKEITEIVGKSETNCKMIFSRAINKLRGKIVMSLLLFLLNI
ncbi:MAG: RNA polymerase sigma-70 factor, ECF subfamily [Parcubacteria group bacterium Licking1014_17]|nr:MAG: RNA polymerase sigma-70 factor, ECF subfamily [Parcubacteria group bacterium Licking1014_17]